MMYSGTTLKALQLLQQEHFWEDMSAEKTVRDWWKSSIGVILDDSAGKLRFPRL